MLVQNATRGWRGASLFVCLSVCLGGCLFVLCLCLEDIPLVSIFSLCSFVYQMRVTEDD